MTEIGFAETRHRVLGLYGEGDHAAAMRLARSAVAQFPDRMDAGLAIALAAKRCPPGVVGFIAVAPNVGLARDLIGADRRAVEGLRGDLIIGERDPRRDECETLAEQLRGDGADVQFEVIEGLRHEYPADFGDRLPQLLA